MCSGSPKLHGDKRTCPAKQKLEPCTCKVKTTGLDITCQRVSRAQMERVATNMKQDIKPSDDVSVTSSRVWGQYRCSVSDSVFQNQREHFAQAA